MYIISGVTLSFSGNTKKIYLDLTGTTTPMNVNISDIYDYWKSWVIIEGSSYLQAFDLIGGESLENGQTVAIYYMLKNGWKIVIRNTSGISIEFIISGNLITSDSSSPFAVSEFIGCTILRSIISTTSLNLTDVVDDINIVNNNILEIYSGLTEHRTATENSIKYILGLVQSNFRIKNQVYNTDNLLTSATIRIYNNSSDTENDVNTLKEYNVEASYNSNGQLITYLVKEF